MKTAGNTVNEIVPILYENLLLPSELFWVRQVRCVTACPRRRARVALHSLM